MIEVADAHVLAGDEGNTHAGFLMTSGGAGLSRTDDSKYALQRMVKMMYLIRIPLTMGFGPDLDFPRRTKGQFTSG